MNTFRNNLKKLWPGGIFSADERRRRSYILNIILIGSMVLIAWADLHILLDSMNRRMHYYGIPFADFTLLLLLFILMYVLFKRGHLRVSSLMLVTTFYLGAAYGSYHWGVSIPAILLSYALIIIVSSILLGNSAGFAVTGVVFFTLLICGYRESTSHLIPSWKYQVVNLSDIIFYSILLMIIMVISWLSNRETERSLMRAMASETALQEERDMLEIKVEERTEALKLAQAERVSELYHFAEFGKLSGGLFHDLVNPLFSVATNIETLESTLHPELPEIKANLERSLRASRKMERFITAVKRQLKIDQFQELFFLNTIIDDVLLLVNYKAMKENVRIQFEAKENIQTYNNPIKFQQIATNLICNAIDAYEGVKAESKIVKVVLSLDGANARLTVTDNGHGIDAAIKDKIFEPFFTTKAHYKGMGLGLSTTKQIVEKDFHGTISIENERNDMTRFVVTFPLTQS